MPASLSPCAASARASTAKQFSQLTLLVTGAIAAAFGLLWFAGELSLALSLARTSAGAAYDPTSDAYFQPQPLSAALVILAGLVSVALGLPRRRRATSSANAMVRPQVETAENHLALT